MTPSAWSPFFPVRRIREAGEHLERAGQVDLVEVLEQERPNVQVNCFGKAIERFVRCIGSALNVRICVFRRRAGSRRNLAIGQRRAIRQIGGRLRWREREVGGGERHETPECEGKIGPGIAGEGRLDDGGVVRNIQ